MYNTDSPKPYTPHPEPQTLKGPAMLPKMKAELAQCLADDGFPNVDAAVGADHGKQRWR